MSFDIGIIFAFVAMLGYGVSNALIKIPSKKINSRKIIFYRNLFMTIIFSIIFLLFFKESTFSLIHILLTLGVSLIGYLGLIFFYKAINVGKIGVVTPIAGSSVLITAILSIIFYNETFHLIKLFSIIGITLGIVLLSINFKDFKQMKKITPGLGLALITTLVWGIVFFLFKIPVNILGPVFTSLLIEGGIMIYSAIHSLIKKDFLVKKKNLFILFIIAFFGSIGTLFFNLGIKFSEVSIVSAITFTSPLVAVIFGRIFYKEKLTMQQYVGVAIILTGIITLSIF
jgi:DME family drug/metabolite transporter